MPRVKLSFHDNFIFYPLVGEERRWSSDGRCLDFLLPVLQRGGFSATLLLHCDRLVSSKRVGRVGGTLLGKEFSHFSFEH